MQKAPFALRRTNLSQQIQEEVRSLIVSGALPEGERMNEVALAAQLGVSRTPLREALSQLVAQSFVCSIPRRGFFVAQLSLEEFEQIYAIRRVLDPAALRLAGLPQTHLLEELEQLNRRIERASEPRRVIELDDDWHLTLLSDCGNQVLLDLIRQFMDRTLRYELAYMSAESQVTVAVEEHRRIQEHLKAGDLGAACEALEQNMTSATGPLTRWLRRRVARDAESS